MAQSWAGRTWDRVVVIIDREGMMLRGLRVRFLWQSGELIQSVWQVRIGLEGLAWGSASVSSKISSSSA